jgi:prevent-host-death family protein
MKIASVADVKAHFSSYLRASEEGLVVVTRNSKPVAVLLAVTDEEELERLMMAYSPRLRAIVDAAQKRIRSGAGIPSEQFWEKVRGSKESKKQERPRTA